jgi:hypothetical protein
MMSENDSAKVLQQVQEARRRWQEYAAAILDLQRQRFAQAWVQLHGESAGDAEKVLDNLIAETMAQKRLSIRELAAAALGSMDDSLAVELGFLNSLGDDPEFLEGFEREILRPIIAEETALTEKVRQQSDKPPTFNRHPNVVAWLTEKLEHNAQQIVTEYLVTLYENLADKAPAAPQKQTQH